MQIGDVVVIRTGINRVKLRTGNIAKISKTGKKVTVTLDSGRDVEFYRDDRKDGSKNVYIETPGAGMFGHMLNNRFVTEEVKSPRQLTNG